MIHIIFLIGGVCCALLCHWMIRHTYSSSLEETGQMDRTGRPMKRKVWNEKVALPRWVYILIWLLCILLAPLSIIAPIAVGTFLAAACSEGDVRFVYTNKFIEWLKKEV